MPQTSEELELDKEKTPGELREIDARNVQPFDQPRYWDVIEMAASSGTFTSNVDWEPQFQKTGVTYVEYGLPTARGEMFIHPDTSHGRAAMATLNFWGEPRTVNLRLNMDNAGLMQVKVSSQVLSQYSSDQTITLDIREGPNTIIVMTNGGIDRLEFKTRLW